MHAHISIKQANKMQNGNEKQIKVRLKSNLWIFMFMFMKIDMHKGWSWNASIANNYINLTNMYDPTHDNALSMIWNGNLQNK
jgi:hypothetical protein